MAEKTEFKTVETSQEDLEELEEKIRRHRHKIARRTALVIVTVVAAVIFVELWSALRTYSGFEVQASAERKDSAATGYKMFQGKILEYDNDGIVCHDTDDRLIWNQSYEMTAPELSVCEQYLAAVTELLFPPRLQKSCMPPTIRSLNASHESLPKTIKQCSDVRSK